MKQGKIGKLIKKQDFRVHFSDIPVGTRFVVLEEVNLVGYDILVCFFDYPPQILSDGKKHWNGYVDRGSYVLED